MNCRTTFTALPVHQRSTIKNISPAIDRRTFIHIHGLIESQLCIHTLESNRKIVVYWNCVNMDYSPHHWTWQLSTFQIYLKQNNYIIWDSIGCNETSQEILITSKILRRWDCILMPSAHIISQSSKKLIIRNEYRGHFHWAGDDFLWFFHHFYNTKIWYSFSKGLARSQCAGHGTISLPFYHQDSHQRLSKN